MSESISVTYHSLRNLIVPCEYGLKCANKKTCGYWHNHGMKIIEMCRYGSNCKYKNGRCRRSHDAIVVGQFDSPCKYGLTCKEPNCQYLHPIDANKIAIGKCNLLHRAVQCTLRLDPRSFDIAVSDSKTIKIPDTSKIVGPLVLTKVVIDRYSFVNGHIYQVFSNKTLGGGTLGYGNVQEEKLMNTLSILQYLLHGYHRNYRTPLSNNLEYDPIVVDTAVIVVDNSYLGYADNTSSPHYGTNGLKIAHDNQIATALYDCLNDPIPIKAICVAVPSFKDWSGSEYSSQILKHVFITLYKSFKTTIIASNNDKHTVQCNIHIGNIGCGVYGHNYNTIYVLQTIAISAAANASTKPISCTYHAYDENTYKQLLQTAIPYVNSISGKSIDCVLAELRHKQQTEPQIWAKKL